MSETAWSLIVVHLFLLGLTVVANANKRKGVSTIIKFWSIDNNWYPCFWGVLTGHYFAPLKQWGLPTVTFWPWCLLLMALFGIYDLINWWKGPFPLIYRFPLWPVLIGIPAGAFLWAS